MKSSNCWSVVIVCSELKVNNLADVDAQVSGNHIQESLEMFGLNLKHIIISLFSLNTLAHELIHDVSGQDWLEMVLLVGVELSSSVQVNAEGWHVDDGLLGVPKFRGQLVCIFLLDNDFASKTKISIEPCSPKSTAIALDIHLLESKLVVYLGMWSQLQNWGISVASNNFEKF